MDKNDDLMSGLQILSPEETMNISTKDEKETTEETPSGEIEKENEELEDDDSLKVVPVNKETENDNESSKFGSPSTNGKPNVFAALIKDLAGEGILTTPEEEKEFEELLNNADVETVKNLMEKTLDGKFKKHQDAWKNSLTSEQKRYLEIEDAFDNTDEAIRIAQRLEYINNISSADLANNPNLQSNLYYEDLILKGFSREEALEAIQEAKSLDKLEEKANKAIRSISAHDQKLVESKRAQIDAEWAQLEKDNKEAFDNLMNTIENRESIVDGLTLNKVSRSKIKDNMLNSVYEDKDGRKYTSLMYKQMKNPQEFDILINYFDTLGLFNIDKNGNFKPDLSKLKTIAKTKATSELEEILNRDDVKVGQRISTKPSDKQESIIGFLERASKNT